MSTINAYLTFNGNCREAMLFYQQCFGGKLSFQTLEDSPMACEMSSSMKNCILHACLVHENFILMGSDIVRPGAMVKGNSIVIAIQVASKECLAKLTKSLSGNVRNFRNCYCRDEGLNSYIEDQFGFYWLVFQKIG